MNYEEMRGMKFALADLTKRLDNQDSVFKVKNQCVLFFTLFSQDESIWLKLIVLFKFVQQTMNSNNYNSENQMEKQIEKRIEERLSSIVSKRNQVNLFVIGFMSFV